MPAAVPPVMIFWKTKSETFASVMPKPVKKLYGEEAAGELDAGSLSAMKAR